MTEPTTPEPADLVTHDAPTLPTLELPEYHGRKPVGMRTKLTGAGTRTTRPHTIGDRYVLVLEVRCRGAAHEETDDGLSYVETAKVLDMFELHGDQGSRLLATIRSIHKLADDRAAGRAEIPGTVVHTDGSGVVLTEAELAELRGDPIRAILSPDLTPAVIVFVDGSRAMWPDEFSADRPRPRPGELVEVDGDHLEVDEVLHHETGEVLEVAAGYEPGSPVAEAESFADEVESFVADAAALGTEILGAWENMTPEQRRAALAALSAEDRAAALGALADLGWTEPEETPEPSAEEEPSAEIPDLPPAPAEVLDDDSYVPPATFLDRNVSTVMAAIRRVGDLHYLQAVLVAERAGSGSRSKPRGQIEAALGARIAQLIDAEDAGGAA